MPGMGLLQRLPPLQTHPWAGRHRAVETAAAVEIEQGSLRRLLLDDFHKLFGKASAKNAPAFPQLPQRRRRRSITKRCGNRNPKNADTRFRLIPGKIYHQRCQEESRAADSNLRAVSSGVLSE